MKNKHRVIEHNIHIGDSLDLFLTITDEFKRGDIIRLSDCYYSGLYVDIRVLNSRTLDMYLMKIINIFKIFTGSITEMKIDFDDEKNFSIVFNDFCLKVKSCKRYTEL